MISYVTSFRFTLIEAENQIISFYISVFCVVCKLDAPVGQLKEELHICWRKITIVKKWNR